MTTRTFQIFKTGTHKTMGGEELLFSSMDVSQTASAYSPSLMPAPLVENHPVSDGPAYGQVKALTYKSGVLHATAEFSEPILSRAKARMYNGVSAKFWRPNDPGNPKRGVWYLRHVGFLKGINPAVKGLEPVAFSAFEWASIFQPQDSVAFSEEEDAELDRDAHLQLARDMVKSRGGSLTAAIMQVDRKWRQFIEQRSRANNMDADRVAFHEAIEDYQSKVGGISYAEAARFILSNA